MNMKIKKYISILIILLVSISGGKAQDAVSLKEEKHIIDGITEDYKNWNCASWDGKLSTDILPLSVTLKVYMKRGDYTLISARAPFLGEVARVEIDKEALLIVNKMKKRYYRRSLEDISKVAPDFAEDVQALLLGRMFVVGSGQLDKRDADKVTLFPTSIEGEYMVVPAVPDYLPEVLYGFATDQDLNMSTFVCAYGRADVSESIETVDPNLQYEPKLQAQADITYQGKKTVADLHAIYYPKEYSATLTVDEIEWGSKGFGRIDIEGLTQVSFRDILKFF